MTQTGPRRGSGPDIGASCIEITGLVKRFGALRALDGVDLRVRSGEVHGFLGPNGAGKSTTIRVLLGLARADAGTVRLLGGDPWRDAVAHHRRIAYVPGDVNLWPQLTGGEAIDLLGRLHGRIDPARRDHYVELFELDPARRGRTYSRGNRQKVALVAALACDAELMILDEPTSGLDPLMERLFQDCIRQERDRGRTVLLSSHVLSEVEALCDRVSIIRSGRIVETGTLAQLRHLTRTAVTAELPLRARSQRDATEAAGDRGTTEELAALSDLPGVHDLLVADRRISLSVSAAGLAGVLSWLGAAGVTAIQAAPPTLEEIFLRHYGATS